LCHIHPGISRKNLPSFVAFAVFAVFAAVFRVADVSAAPITFNTALPVAEGEFVFRGQAVVDRSGDDPSGADRDRTAWSVVSVLGYGATSNLALFGVLPYVDKRLDITVAGARQTRSARGIGDFSIFGRYTVFRKDQPGRTFRIAPFFGVETPTGDDDERDEFGRLPPSVQPGSGSFDPFAGVVATYQTLQFQIDAQASYKANTEANGFEFGDVARLDGSIQYRLWPRRLGKGVPDFLYAVLEANLVHQDENRVGGTENSKSGGTTLFIAPGIQYVSKRWILEASVHRPWRIPT
jgi:hypothetical protein